MRLKFTQEFNKKAVKLTKKNLLLKKKLLKQVQLFGQNPLHPSLKLHKLKGNRSSQYAIWIDGNLRALCIWDNDECIFLDLVTHDQY